MHTPLVSVCVVTKRPALAKWVVWNYSRQLYANTELVVIPHTMRARAGRAIPWSQTYDSAPLRGGYQRRAVIEPFDAGCSGGPPLTPLGAIFNKAVKYARGDALVFWGDDDWHHPYQIGELVHALENPSVPFAGYRTGWFLDFLTGEVRGYTGSRIYPAAAIYRKKLIADVLFDDLPKNGVDTRWDEKVRRKLGDGFTIRGLPYHSFYVDHDDNVSKARRGNMDPIPLQKLIDWIEPEVWADTSERLEAFRRYI